MYVRCTAACLWVRMWGAFGDGFGRGWVSPHQTTYSLTLDRVILCLSPLCVGNILNSTVLCLTESCERHTRQTTGVPMVETLPVNAWRGAEGYEDMRTVNTRGGPNCVIK